MEIEVSRSNPTSSLELEDMLNELDQDPVRLKLTTLQAVVERCQRAIESLNNTNGDGNGAEPKDREEEEEEDDEEPSQASSSASSGDREANELCDLLKSRVECPNFLEKLECAKVSVPQNVPEEGGSWDVVSKNDLWDGESIDADQDDYVLVRQEDIVDGIACFMAAYLLSLKQTKELTPNQLQEALCKTFAVKKKKGKLRKALDGSKVIYNVASWGATAIGIYQNPVLLKAASKAFSTSFHVITKLL